MKIIDFLNLYYRGLFDFGYLDGAPRHGAPYFLAFKLLFDQSFHSYEACCIAS